MREIRTPQEMLGQLISFNTISALSNKDMIKFIADYLAGHGINSSTGGNEDGTKADLIATIGPNVEGGLVLSGHTDVVPVEGQTGTRILSRWWKWAVAYTAEEPAT